MGINKNKEMRDMSDLENTNGWNTNPENSTEQEPTSAPAENGTAAAYTAQPESGSAQSAGGRNTCHDSWSYPGNSAKAPKPHKEKKAHKGVGRIIAVALVCAILGGLGGGAITGAVAYNRYSDETQALQQQIDDLKSQDNGKGSTTIVTSVSSEGLKSGAQIYAENVDAVVSITTQGVSNGQGFQSMGTGFIISEDGYILTNHHVIANGQKVTVTTNEGDEYDATVVGSDEYYDVALLKVEATSLPTVTIGDSDQTTVGEEVVAIGNALGELTASFTGGYLSGKDRMVSTDGTSVPMMQTDAAINSGNSGGPLFNMKGEVIGITSAKYSGSTSSGASIEGIGFAIPIDDVMKLVDDLKTHGHVTGRAQLGVMVQDMQLDSSVAKAYGLPKGVQVVSVNAGSAAEAAGVQANDIITALGSDKIESTSDLRVALQKRSAGDSDTITVYRNGQQITLNITFEEKADDSTTESTEATEPSENQGSGENQMPGKDDSWDDWYEFFHRFFGNGQ